MNSTTIDDRLGQTHEQKAVVGPLVAYLVNNGWNLEQIIFGKKEWRVPKSPSQATLREKGQSFDGFPVDIAVFDDSAHTGDPRHLLFMVECKQPTEEAGVDQLESYFVAEPHSNLGIWANNPSSSAPAVFVYRGLDGRLIRKSRQVAHFPRPGESIEPDSQRQCFSDLVAPSEQTLKKIMEDLLDKIVIGDSNVTRRDEQLDQLCNLLLLKLESDKQAKSEPDLAVFFRPLESANKTAAAVRNRYDNFVALYPKVFVTDQDKTLRFSDETIAACVKKLTDLQLIDLGVSTISLAFQVLRSEALKQGEDQILHPKPSFKLVCGSWTCNLTT